MKKIQKPLVSMLAILFVCSSVILFSELLAEARVGGGRSFGSRGSRSVAPRSFGGGSPGYRTYQPSYQQQQPYQQAQPIQNPSLSGGGSGTFLRGLAGGLAGGFLGSMLFRNTGYGAGGIGMNGGGGGGGIGFIEILLVAGIIFFVVRMLMTRKTERNESRGRGPATVPDFYDSRPTGAISAGEQSYAPVGSIEAVEAIRRFDSSFDPQRFKDMCLDNFFNIQAAWMQRDLSSVKNVLTPEVAQGLEADAAKLKAAGRINRVENVAVRKTDIIEAWQELGKEYVTVHFNANLVDYTIDESTGTVVDGNRTQPIKFEEYWTYMRDVGAPGSIWTLTAIQQS